MRKAAAFGVVLLLLVSPILGLLVSRAMYEAACQFGDAGMHVSKPFKIDIVTFGERDRWGTRTEYLRRVWKGREEFLANCDHYCVTELGYLYQTTTPWSTVRDSNVAIEESWVFNSPSGKVLRHGRFWIAPLGTSACLAPLDSETPNVPSNKCVAGQEILAISARYVVEPYPFTEPARTTQGWLPWPTSKEWEWLSVERHQNWLLEDGKLIAKYVWYEWSQGLWTKTCPDGEMPSHVKDRVFWRIVLSYASKGLVNAGGATDDAPNRVRAGF